MKILIATDDLTFTVGLAAEYLRRGFELHTGTSALLLRQQAYDLVHCHWPEELAGWAIPPDPQRAFRALDALDRVGRHGKRVCTIHNLMPHLAHGGDERSRNFYEQFLQRMERIGHFTETSRLAAIAAYPAIPAARHFVHGMNRFDEVAVLAPGRAVARAELGLPADRFVVATFGQLRSSDELQLITQAINRTKHAPVVLFASRLPPGLKRKHPLTFMGYVRWLKRHNVRALDGYLSDAQAATVFDAADAVIVPRSGRHLNSGLLPLAMSFGTPLIVPDYGIYTELLGKTENAFFWPGDPVSLSQAIDRLAVADVATIRAANLRQGRAWGWRNAVDRILEATGLDLVDGKPSPELAALAL